MSDWLYASAQGKPERVDRVNNRLNGYVVAQTGVFKSGRGEFDHKALKLALRLMKAKAEGTKVRMGHTDLGSVGSFLGRAVNPRIEAGADGQEKLRADLQFNSVAFNSPAGDLGSYVMDLAESDPEALSSSLVLMADMEYQLDSSGRKKRDKDGRELAPLWRPTHIEFSDIVGVGDAVGSLLSASTKTLPELIQFAHDCAKASKLAADSTCKVLRQAEVDGWERAERARQVREWELEVMGAA